MGANNKRLCDHIYDREFRKFDQDGSVLVRTDEVKDIRIDNVNSFKIFEGRTYKFGADTDEAVWQIKRKIILGTETITQWANEGKYDQVWDDRESLFATAEFDNQYSLLFPGNDEYISLGDNFDFGPAQAFSWSWWFKANNFAAQRAFIAKTTQDSNVFGYSFQHNSSGRLFSQFRASGTLRNYTASTVMTAGQWYHCAATYAGGSNINGLTMYLDESAEPTPSSGSLNDWSHSDELQFGQRGTTFNFSGNMLNICVYDKELSSSEVADLRNGGTPPDPTGLSSAGNLVGFWPLNDPVNFPTEVDQVGSVNGTLVNMADTDYDFGDLP